MTYRLSRDEWQRVHELAREQGISLNQLVRQGLSRLFSEQGLPGLDDLTP
jgi:predicted HicB family RNase H-like nuclease